MFGQKQKKIEELQKSLVFMKEDLTWAKGREDVARKEAVTWKANAGAFQKAYEESDKFRSEAAEEIIRLATQNRDYEKQIEDARQEYDNKVFARDYAINESKELNQALEEDNKDLIRQVELYQAVLSQLRVNISLPEKKKARK